MLTASGLCFPVVLGIKYFRPGSTSLTELTYAGICFMLSIIISFSSQNIILLCFPISSTIRNFLHKSPISSKCSTSNRIIRSSPGWVMAAILPLLKCFLRSIQKFGAVSGLGLLSCNIYTSGRLALADKRSLYCSLLFLIVMKSSSSSGWAILYKRPPSSLSFISLTSAATTKPSNAILIPHLSFILHR